ncbi:mechanosensitive ion channel family protein [Pistricoccus aurantiacus]|uniref:Small-conductance mechanosensitive channel n=1 Tax=Pistricoccus aurantiacus TaxID=1883414 RepID=A0A5B8SSV3_9GAMM|nr:mechanosensitive ion channel family protein [Pistricoccus aurantiacus]QEA37870.1 mechanosensitive ion channel family protein [Pistricoccus aurantiacus]
MAEQASSQAGTAGLQDTPQQMDMDFGASIERIDSWIDGAIRLLPNLIVAVVLLILFYGLGLLARHLIRRQSTRKQRDNLGEVLGGFVKWVVILIGFLLAATIVIPTLKPGDLIAGLGVSSVAIGFAFKDILQNWLEGLLILLRQPFNIDDQIRVNDHEGTVERIENRATIIKTYDGQRIVVPNSDIYTNAVLVKTAHEKRRSQYDIGIGYGDGIDKACAVIRKAVAGVAGVEKEPAPEALPWDLAASWVTIRVRWWTHSRRADVVQVHASIIKAMKEALDEARIDMPYETNVQLFHDQTETTDGDRGAQREGWPAPEAGTPRPRWQAQVERGASAKPQHNAD